MPRHQQQPDPELRLPPAPSRRRLLAGPPAPFLLLIPALLLGTSGMPPTAQAQEADTPVVVTRGEGVVWAAPDRAFVTIQAESRAPNPRQAQRQNAEAMTAVRQRLDEFELGDDAIRTVGVQLQPEYDFRDGRRTLRGYRAVNTIEVRVDDVARIGEILDASVGAGATSVSGVRFDVRDRTSLERQALREAVADARARADAAAAGAGATIDRVIRIEEQGTSQPLQPQLRMAMQSDAAEATTPVAPGEIEVRAHVTLTAGLR